MKRFIALCLVLLATPAWGYPGQAIKDYLSQNPGFRKTGGVAHPSLGKFDLYESTGAKEYTFSAHLISCDPLDKTGYVQVPKTVLYVKGGKIVGERVVILVNKPEACEQAVESLTPYLKAGTFMQKVRGWMHAAFKTPLLEPVVNSGSTSIYQVSYANGQAKLSLLVPDLEALPLEIPKGVTSGATMKQISYLTRYEEIVMGDLAKFIVEQGKKDKKHKKAAEEEEE